MEEYLQSLIDEGGALVARYLVTAAVVLFLIGLVYWLVRRVSRFRLGSIGRGRVPRLAIVDALTIDNRRRLVLVRRDNVEHLILIGGPSDLVVEPSIVRLRQRPPQAAARPPQAQPPQSPGGGPALPVPPVAVRSPEGPAATLPIPFPPRQSAPGQGPPGLPMQPSQRAVAAANFAGEAARRPAPVPLVTAGASTLAPAVGPSPGEGAPPVPGQGEMPEPFLPGVVRPPPEAEEGLARLELAAAAIDAPHAAAQRRLDLGEAPAPQGEARDATAKVSDLEEEMARLLGQITATRGSL
ncbi:MAG: flagellar biosynthetic protein FliO [Bauldia sp.]